MHGNYDLTLFALPEQIAEIDDDRRADEAAQQLDRLIEAVELGLAAGRGDRAAVNQIFNQGRPLRLAQGA